MQKSKKDIVVKFFLFYLAIFTSVSLLYTQESDDGVVCVANNDSSQTASDYAIDAVGAWFDSLDFFTPKRFDLISKYIYAKCYEWGVKSSWPEDLYTEIIRIWVRFTDSVSQKYTKEDFVNSFNATLVSIKKNGFIPGNPIIPVGMDGNIIDGAHRVAASCFYNKKVFAIKNSPRGAKATAQFFKVRNEKRQGCLTEQDFGEMVIQYCALKKNSRTIIIFPPVAPFFLSAFKKKIETASQIVYAKTIAIGERGLINLLKIMDLDNAASESMKKSLAVTQKLGKQIKITVSLVDCFSEENVKSLADICNIKSKTVVGPVYCTASHDQALTLAQTLFNENSLHFINYADQRHFENFNRLLPLYEQFLATRKFNKEFFCVDGSSVLAAYGIRDCNDLDFIHHGYDFLQKEFPNGGQLNSHNGGGLRFHTAEKDDLIFNPRYYFYYKNLKILTLNELLKTKEKRGSAKDLNDIKNSTEFIQNGPHIMQSAGYNKPIRKAFRTVE